MITDTLVVELELPNPNTFNFSSVYFKWDREANSWVYIFINDDEAREVMRAYALVNTSFDPVTLNKEGAFRISIKEYIQLFGNPNLLTVSPRQQAIREQNDLYLGLVKNLKEF